ncbi:hypothetical protein BT96DRAFT_949692 [Gymnopus androsaceus JB14]|uniref:Uncharacterized protein n=1 Tax=Gymnopus androsaceus JB14 TaxID=1447944 RepID=A0A6A4GJX3_9AGAR|nr:hypothetical protein BT96DRAFT_949692 [Gymnopus androsaceus JB14]
MIMGQESYREVHQELLRRGERLEVLSERLQRRLSLVGVHASRAVGEVEVALGITRRYRCEALSFQYRYVPIGLLEMLPSGSGGNMAWAGILPTNLEVRLGMLGKTREDKEGMGISVRLEGGMSFSSNLTLCLCSCRVIQVRVESPNSPPGYKAPSRLAGGPVPLIGALAERSKRKWASKFPTRLQDSVEISHVDSWRVQFLRSSGSK